MKGICRGFLVALGAGPISLNPMKEATRVDLKSVVLEE
jgi:hypothetical protein